GDQAVLSLELQCNSEPLSRVSAPVTGEKAEYGLALADLTPNLNYQLKCELQYRERTYTGMGSFLLMAY
ncbi:MAG: hypothetical protein GX564_06410, partial [Oligosphaeraceae bacterium]|nr:hypothetical protein [Oligosphaeraceae bacterium]